MSSLPKPEFLTGLCAVLAGLLVVLCGGCGSAEERMGKDYTNPSPPSHAGTLAALENTQWGVEGGKLVFLSNGIAQQTLDADPSVVLMGQYSLEENGLLNLFVRGSSLAGVATWDGEKIILGDTELTPLGAATSVATPSMPRPPVIDGLPPTR